MFAFFIVFSQNFAGDERRSERSERREADERWGRAEQEEARKEGYG